MSDFFEWHGTDINSTAGFIAQPIPFVSRRERCVVMRTVYEREIAGAAKIEGRISAGADGFVQSLVGPVCKVLWPEKTDAHVAAICGCDPRNARRYMSGEIPLPSILLAAINVRLTQRS